MATVKTFIGNIKGTKGDDGKSGVDGVSATHSWDGTVLTIHSASGTSSADLKGEKGDRGEDGIQGKDGVSGVYVGSGDFPEGYNIKIDPNGEANDDVVTRTEFDAVISEQNKNFKWKHLGTTYNGAPLDISTVSFKELMIEIRPTNRTYDGYIFSILAEMLEETEKKFNEGYGYTTSNVGLGQIAICSSYVKVCNLTQNGTSILSSSEMHVYYR